MKLMKSASILFAACASVVMLTAAFPSTNVTPERKAAVAASVEAAAKDGKITYSELKGIATTAKGSKLTLKEKVALKVFGKKISSKATSPAAEGKSQLIAAILCFAIGGLGVHRFYLGYTWQGIVQLLTAGGCGVWALIDLIRILMGTLQPKNGEYASTL
jgi:hypothetical protein